MEKIKVCLICEKYQLQREYLPFHEALERKFDLTRFFADEKWPQHISEIHQYDAFAAIIWFVRFRKLIEKPAFRWGNYTGLKIMHDQDALNNFSLIAGPRYIGAWPEVFRRNEFNILSCTGKTTRDHLLEQGVNAFWVPKAYDRKMFFDKREPRAGICYFGSNYAARAAMLHYLQRKDIKVERFRCSHFELNDCLNRYYICLICNMVGIVKPGINRLINRFISSYGIKLYQGPEPMLKNFEVAASGCVPFCDVIPELSDLGFEDGKTMVSYRNFDELIEKIKYYLRFPELLSEIGNNAAKLCAENHTWDNRAIMFEDLIRQYSKPL